MSCCGGNNSTEQIKNSSLVNKINSNNKYFVIIKKKN